MAKKSTELAVAPLKAVPQLITEATAVSIKTQADMLPAAEVLSRLNQISDALTKEKEKLTRPLNATLKEIRGRYKPAEEQLDGAIEHIRAEMSAYQTQAARAADAEAAKIAARVAPGRGHFTAETAVKKFGEIDTPAAQVQADSGSVEFRTQKKLAVLDHTTLVGWLAQMHPELLSYNDRDILMLFNGGEAPAGAAIDEVQVPINHR